MTCTLIAGCDSPERTRPAPGPASGSPTAEPEAETAETPPPQEAQPALGPAPPAEAARARPCTTPATAFGCTSDELDLGRAELRRRGNFVFLEDGLVLFYRDSVVHSLRLRPCPALRGDFDHLRSLGFEVAPDTHVISFRDAVGLAGDNDFHLEGRPAQCSVRWLGPRERPDPVGRRRVVRTDRSRSPGRRRARARARRRRR